MDEYKRKSHADLRLCAAMIGCSAVTAMAAIGLMVFQEHDGAAAAKTGPTAAHATSSQTTPSNALAVGGQARLEGSRTAAVRAGGRQIVRFASVRIGYPT
jgi:hypothetical protein